MQMPPCCARVWPFLCLIGLLAGCRAERVAFQFQPARSTIRPDSAVLVPPTGPSVGNHPEEKPIAKRVARSVGTPAPKTKRPGRVRTVLREKAPAIFRVCRTLRTPSIAQHNGYRAPTDSLHGLPGFVAILGLPFLALCIVGIATGTTWLAITAGILAAFLFIFALVLSGS
jgi:hypothetical protein